MSIVLLMVQGGLRVGEVCKLNLDLKESKEDPLPNI